MEDALQNIERCFWCVCKDIYLLAKGQLSMTIFWRRRFLEFSLKSLSCVKPLGNVWRCVLSFDWTATSGYLQQTRFVCLFAFLSFGVTQLFSNIYPILSICLPYVVNYALIKNRYWQSGEILGNVLFISVCR